MDDPRGHSRPRIGVADARHARRWVANKWTDAEEKRLRECKLYRIIFRLVGGVINDYTTLWWTDKRSRVPAKQHAPISPK